MGCSGGPARVAPPEIDPEGAARAALELYDRNADERLDEQELAACPGMLRQRTAYDANQDGVIDQAEIAARLGDLLRHEVGLTQLKCRVRYRGRPLAGAAIVFEPEPYLGPQVLPARGVTDADGGAQLSIDAEALPEDLRRLRAVHYGTFKVRITHPQIALPAQYHEQTQLGYETEAGNPFVNFDLTDRP
jgi:hypothetical protein